MEENIQDLLSQVVSVSFLLVAIALFFVIQNNREQQLELLTNKSSEMNAVMSNSSSELIENSWVTGNDLCIQIVKGLEYPASIQLDNGGTLYVNAGEDYTTVNTAGIVFESEYWVEYEVNSEGQINRIEYVLK